MKEIFADLYNRVVDFFTKTEEKEDTKTKTTEKPNPKKTTTKKKSTKSKKEVKEND